MSKEKNHIPFDELHQQLQGTHISPTEIVYQLGRGLNTTAYLTQQAELAKRYARRGYGDGKHIVIKVPNMHIGFHPQLLPFYRQTYAKDLDLSAQLLSRANEIGLQIAPFDILPASHGPVIAQAYIAEESYRVDSAQGRELLQQIPIWNQELTHIGKKLGLRSALLDTYNMTRALSKNKEQVFIDNFRGQTLVDPGLILMYEPSGVQEPSLVTHAKEYMIAFQRNIYNRMHSLPNYQLET